MRTTGRKDDYELQNTALRGMIKRGCEETCYKQREKQKRSERST